MKKSFKLYQLVCIIILAGVLGEIVYYYHVQRETRSFELRETAKRQREASDSFYQKLRDGFDVNILVIGDSIGAGSGTQTEGKQWFNQLQSYLYKTYEAKVTITNISMGGNSSYAGYVRTMALNYDSDFPTDFDLAILCYGQNDSIDNFSRNYESIIRAVEAKYLDCSIISILESSQREYTEKMQMIVNLADYYGIVIAGTIGAFNNSGMDYDELSFDGTHPNDAGQDIYYDVVKSTIDAQVEAYKDAEPGRGKMESVSVVNEEVKKFDNFIWYGVSDWTREDCTFTLLCEASGIFGIDYTYVTGENKADICVDGETFKSVAVTFDYDFSQRHIFIVDEDVTVEREIKIMFESKEQADGFYGICFSWK